MKCKFLRVGLVCRIVPEDLLFSAALEIARRMIAKTPLGLRFTKEAMYLNADATLEAAVELENRNQSICCSNPDFLKAVVAFQKK